MKTDPSFESPFNQSIVALAMGMSWPMMQETPFPKENTPENGFTQQVVGAGIGQDWALMEGNPFGKDGKDESGLFEGLTATLSLNRQLYCGKYCKALGYARSSDKFAFKKCKNQCLIHFQDIKRGSFKIKPFDDAAMNVDPSSIPDDTTLAEYDKLPPPTAGELEPVTESSNTAMYVIGGIVLLLIIIFIVVMIMRRRAGK